MPDRQAGARLVQQKNHRSGLVVPLRLSLSLSPCVCRCVCVCVCVCESRCVCFSLSSFSSLFFFFYPRPLSPPFFPVSLSPLLSLWCFSPSLLLEGTTGGKTPIEGRRRRREQRETTGKKKNNPSHSAFVFACFSFVCFLARFFHPIFAWLTRVVVFQKREGKRPGREGGEGSREE